MESTEREQNKKIDEILKISVRTEVKLDNLEKHVDRQNGRIGRLEVGAVTLLLSVVGYLIYAVTAFSVGAS